MNRYYIYALCDSSKPGFYKYDNLILEYEPFYIGKGTNGRNYHSMFDRNNCFKKNKIKSLKNKNIEILTIKLVENLSNEEALSLEVDTIYKIGRRDQNKGTLTNLTDGGEGRVNSYHSEETKRKISETKKLQNLRIKHTEETKMFLRKINQGENNPMFGKTHTDKVREEHSLRISGDKHPMFGKRHDEETIKKIKERRNQSLVQERLNKISSEFNSKSVLQYALDGEFISEFSSIKEASKKLNISESLIGKCCRGKIKKPGKFIFKFKDEKSLILNNSYIIKIGGFFEVNGEEYKLVKRNKSSCLVEKESKIYTFRKKDYPLLFEKIKLELV